MRAAESIETEHNVIDFNYEDQDRVPSEQVAEIIDRETGLPELIASFDNLLWLIKECRVKLGFTCEFATEQRARDQLVKAKGDGK